MKLISGDIGQVDSEYYFSEWSELKLDLPAIKTTTTSNLNTLHLYFEPTEIEPEEVILLAGKSQKNLGKWSSYMKLHFSKIEFDGFMSGKLKLALRKKFTKAQFYLSESDESIRQKTYKVHFFDGTKSKVSYVSKELPFEKLLKVLGIKGAIKVTDELLFFNSLDRNENQWFEREYLNGNRALVFSSIEELRKNFYNKFTQKKLDLKRENGSPTAIEFGNKANSKIYLYVRPTKTYRTFEDYTEKTQHRSGSRAHGSDDAWTCIHYLRKVKSVVTEVPTIEEFVNNLNPGLETEKDIQIIEQKDERGIFWEVMISNAVENLTLTLSGLNPSTFTTTGEHAYDCGHRGKGSTAATPTHPEGKLSFVMESFVEKIQ